MHNGREEQEKLAPQVGLEPTTLRLTAECSAIELLRNTVAHGPKPQPCANNFYSKTVQASQGPITIALYARLDRIVSTNDHETQIDNVLNRMLKISFVRPVLNCIYT